MLVSEKSIRDDGTPHAEILANKGSLGFRVTVLRTCFLVSAALVCQVSFEVEAPPSNSDSNGLW